MHRIVHSFRTKHGVYERQPDFFITACGDRHLGYFWYSNEQDPEYPNLAFFEEIGADPDPKILPNRSFN